MLQETYLNAEGKENRGREISFVHLFMLVFSIVFLNRFIGSAYPIALLIAIELMFFLKKKKFTVNYIVIAWLVNIGVIAVRTVTWDQTNIKIFLSYIVGFLFLIITMGAPLKISYIFNRYMKFFLVAIVLITPLIQTLTPSLSIWGEAGTGIVGKTYYVHIAAFIWIAYCLFSGKASLLKKTATILLAAVVVMLTGSRSNFLTIPATIGIVYLLESAKGEAVKRIAKFSALVLLVAIVTYSVGKYFQMDSILRILDTVERMLNGRDYSNGRNALAEMAMNDFRSAPMWGIGWMNFSDYHIGQSYSNYNGHNF